jgi:hypothetical protein
MRFIELATLGAILGQLRVLQLRIAVLRMLSSQSDCFPHLCDNYTMVSVTAKVWPLCRSKAGRSDSVIKTMVAVSWSSGIERSNGRHRGHKEYKGGINMNASCIGS